MNKICVLGSNSFSGAHFVDHCLNNELDVIGISRSPEPSPAFLPYKANPLKKNFKFYQFDLNHQVNEIAELINRLKPEYIVNFAAQGMVGQSWEDPEHWINTNFASPVKLHDKLRCCSFIKKFVQISTPEVYGNTEGSITESTLYHPSTPYAVSKAAVDMSLMTFYKFYKFPVVFTRSANVYGPGQQLYRIIPRAILYIKLNKKIQLHGGGHSVRSFIHIRDVAKATLKIAQEGTIGEVYHISTKVYISIRELVELICKQMHVDFEKFVESADERPGKDQAYILDSSKLCKQLKWEERIGLEEGLSETINWVNNSFNELKKQPIEYIHKE